MAGSSTSRRLVWIAVPLLVIVALAAVWNWDWFIPIVQSRASAALDRPVSIAHLHVRLGRTLQITADTVVVGNPPDWPAGDAPFATADHLTIQADAWGYIRGQGLILPLIDLAAPRLNVAETPDGKANYHFASGGGGTPVRIGDLRIEDGEAHVVIAKLKADFKAQIATQGDGADAKIVVDAKGTYAAQPITAHLVGGALLSLRDQRQPWPVELALANGPTRVALNGTLQDPLAFRGADVALRLSGPDMSLLEPLVGFPIPKTPAYQITGKLDLQGLETIRFQDLRGRLGNSDIAGTIEVKPSGAQVKGKDKPAVMMNLRSNRVNLQDLSGFIGGTPTQPKTGTTVPQAAVEPARSGKFLPDTAISVPRLSWADIHLNYHGAHIEGRTMPLDDVTVVLDLVDERITIHPISFGVGKGRLLANIDLAPVSGKQVRAKVDLRLQNLDVARIMAATHTFDGAGSVSGVGALDSTGDSLSSLLANGNGQVKMAMAGGNLSAVLVDLTGLHFGNALLSALGLPNQTPVQCFVGDLGLRRGIIGLDAVTLDTGEAITNVGGNIDLGKETIDLALKTDAKHFSIGSLPTRIAIGGTLKNPSIRPGAEGVARAGAVAGLAALFAPLAILPTVQFGTSDAEDQRCGELLRQARASADGQALPAAPKQPKQP